MDKISDETLQVLSRAVKVSREIHKADDKKLLWLLMNTESWGNLIPFSTEETIFDEISERLYPEYDGDKITFEEWGWNTPDGEIRYINGGNK